MSTKPFEIIACSVFRYELEKISESLPIPFPINYFNSYLHLYPTDLLKELNDKINSILKEHKSVLLICGECHPFMKEMLNNSEVRKIPGCNCVEIFIGKSLRKKLLKEGTFFLLPEWTMRWREIFSELLELPQEQIVNLFQEQHKKFVYLNTGVMPVPIKELEECASFFNLSYEIINISLELMVNAMKLEIANMNENNE